jgi:hypothetical protein
VDPQLTPYEGLVVLRAWPGPTVPAGTVRAAFVQPHPFDKLLPAIIVIIITIIIIIILETELDWHLVQPSKLYICSPTQGVLETVLSVPAVRGGRPVNHLSTASFFSNKLILQRGFSR